MKKTLVFTVTNDLSYDQRMIRICSSLAMDKYSVLLVGRKFSGSIPFLLKPFKQHRIRCLINTGFLGYAEYNLRLLIFLLRIKADLLCAIDLDTIIPVFFASRIKRIPRVYDAHELFCEMKEVSTRPIIYRCWKAIEKVFVPAFQYGYTVNQPIADEFYKMYKLRYAVIKNVPLLRELNIPEKPEKYILYQGSVNEGRCFETLIPAMRSVDARLVICGDGNFMGQVRDIVQQNGLEDKIIFKGKLLPAELYEMTRHAYVGITLFDKAGLSNYYSLANRFFDYMHAGVPQLCVDYPVYRSIIEKYPFAVLISDLDEKSIANAINGLLGDAATYRSLQLCCIAAREKYNWQQEEKILLEFYEQILNDR